MTLSVPENKLLNDDLEVSNFLFYKISGILNFLNLLVPGELVRVAIMLAYNQ